MMIGPIKIMLKLAVLAKRVFQKKTRKFEITVTSLINTGVQLVTSVI